MFHGWIVSYAIIVAVATRKSNQFVDDRGTTNASGMDERKGNKRNKSSHERMESDGANRNFASTDRFLVGGVELMIK